MVLKKFPLCPQKKLLLAAGLRLRVFCGAPLFYCLIRVYSLNKIYIRPGASYPLLFDLSLSLKHNITFPRDDQIKPIGFFKGLQYLIPKHIPFQPDLPCLINQRPFTLILSQLMCLKEIQFRVKVRPKVHRFDFKHHSRVINHKQISRLGHKYAHFLIPIFIELL